MTFRPMLAKDGDPSNVAWPQIAQPKLDGIRASIVGGKLVSRTLKPIPNGAIRAALERPDLDGLDGELIVGNPSDPGCYRRTCSFVMAPDKTGADWSFHVFDKWNVQEPFEARRAAYEAIVEAIPAPVVAVPSCQIDSLAEFEHFEAELLAAGHEGVILRDPRAPYKFGRSGKTGPLLKVKRFVDFEATVIGTYEELHNANEAKRNALGRTERSTSKAGKVGKGALGGLILRADDGTEFRCGTGFDSATRSALWAERDSLVGRTAKIKSFPIGVKDKPRHPVWLGWRDLAVDG